MEDVMNYMWLNDRSGVFDFNDVIMQDFKATQIIIRMFALSTLATTEKEFGTETFALLTASGLLRLCKSNAVKIQVEARNVVTETLAQRKLLDWK